MDYTENLRLTVALGELSGPFRAHRTGCVVRTGSLPGRKLHPVTDRDDLLRHIRERAILRGQFTLSSGRQAGYYLDLRRVTLAGVAAPMVGRVLRELTADWSYDAVGGLTIGADPVAAAMMHAAAAEGQPIDCFVVRKDRKPHGLQRRVEGPDVAGRRVLAVEDTSTTGGSVLTAVEALREAWGNRRRGGGAGRPQHWGAPARRSRRAGVPGRLQPGRSRVGLASRRRT